MKITLTTLVAAIFLCSGCNRRASSPNADWPKYGGNNFGNRYSSLDQINKDNVKDLKVTGKVPDAGDNKGYHATMGRYALPAYCYSWGYVWCIIQVKGLCSGSQNREGIMEV